MADLVSKIKELYSAFGSGDVATILGSVTEDCSWEFEAPAELSWSGNRRGLQQIAGFFTGIAAEHADPVLQMTEFFESDDAVAAFGRYDRRRFGRREFASPYRWHTTSSFTTARSRDI